MIGRTAGVSLSKNETPAEAQRRRDVNNNSNHHPNKNNNINSNSRISNNGGPYHGALRLVAKLFYVLTRQNM